MIWQYLDRLVRMISVRIWLYLEENIYALQRGLPWNERLFFGYMYLFAIFARTEWRWPLNLFHNKGSVITWYLSIYLNQDRLGNLNSSPEPSLT